MITFYVGMIALGDARLQSVDEQLVTGQRMLASLPADTHVEVTNVNAKKNCPESMKLRNVKQ